MGEMTGVSTMVEAVVGIGRAGTVGVRNGDGAAALVLIATGAATGTGMNAAERFCFALTRRPGGVWSGCCPVSDGVILLFIFSCRCCGRRRRWALLSSLPSSAYQHHASNIVPPKQSSMRSSMLRVFYWAVSGYCAWAG